MVLSSSTLSHTPSTLFPDGSISKHHPANMVQPLPAVVSNRSSTLSPYGRSDSSRRHTAYMPSSPRREVRPLRSSPLAGPAVSHDGTITASDEDSEESNKPKYRPNRISSTPDIASLNASAPGRASASAPGSPTGTLRGKAPPPQPLDLPGYGPRADSELTTSPEPAVTSKRVKRLSRGLKAITSLPGLPSLPLKEGSVNTKVEGEQTHARGHSEGGRYTNSSSEEIPTVPPIPEWARSSTSSSASISASLTPKAQKPTRRPSTAPSVTSTLSVHSLASSHSTSSLSSQLSQQSRSTPSTSRNPELNWMTVAATPKFSRLGLKGEGVILPVSAKAARRKSAVSLLSLVPEDPDADKAKAQQKDKVRASSSMKRPPSLKSIVSAKPSGGLPDAIETPMPPFRSASASTSSVASTASGSDVLRTPSLSLSRSTSLASSVDELGAVKDDQGEEGHGGVELRVNDVTVEIIGMRSQDGEKEKVEAKAAAAVTITMQPSYAQASKAGKEVKSGRPGSLKRVWKRIFGSVRGRPT